MDRYGMPETILVGFYFKFRDIFVLQRGHQKHLVGFTIRFGIRESDPQGVFLVEIAAIVRLALKQWTPTAGVDTRLRRVNTLSLQWRLHRIDAFIFLFHAENLFLVRIQPRTPSDRLASLSVPTSNSVWLSRNISGPIHQHGSILL